MTSLANIFLVGLGAILGALLRYALVSLSSVFAVHWLGVLCANVLGCFLAGGVIAWSLSDGVIKPWLLPLVMIGFLGSLTTFSALGVDSLHFFLRSEWLMLATNVLLNIILGLAAVWAGFIFIQST